VADATVDGHAYGQSRRLRRLGARVPELLSPRALARRRRLRAERRAADEELLESRWASPLLAWRVNELVVRANRIDLARSIRSTVRDSDARYLPGASPLNRVAVRAESPRLLAIARRLEDARPVNARGVLVVDRLLLDGLGPLYSRERAAELPAHLDDALDALEP